MFRANATLTGVLLLLGACAAPGRPSIDTSVDLTFADLDRAPLDLDAALRRGETVALVFWQPTCGACRKEAPAVNRAVERHGETVRFVGVVPGESFTDAELRDVAATWEYDFPQVRDRDQSLCRALGVRATPTLLVIGSDREVRYRGHVLPGDWKPLIDRPPRPPES